MSSATKITQLRAILDAFLCAREKIDNNLEGLARGYGLCGSQLLVVLDAMAHPGTGLTELCGRTGLKKSVASKQVDALVGKGLLIRSGIEGDRRAVALSVDRSLSRQGLCAGESIKSLFPGWKKSDNLDSLVDALSRLSELAECNSVYSER